MNDLVPLPSARRSVLIVDDHPVTRKGLAQLLDGEPDLAAVGQADDSIQALAALHRQPFDLVILDISLRGVSGIDLLKDLRIHWPKLPVLVFSMHDETLYAERALRVGARGYVMKQESPTQITTAIRRVLDGKLYVSDTINGRMLHKLLGSGGTDGNTATVGNVIDLLSNRELEVFQFIGRGHGTRDIATEMHVSVKTIETYRAHIKEKLRLKTAPELIRFAVNWAGQQGGM